MVTVKRINSQKGRQIGPRIKKVCQVGQESKDKPKGSRSKRSRVKKASQKGQESKGMPKGSRIKKACQKGQESKRHAKRAECRSVVSLFYASYYVVVGYLCCHIAVLALWYLRSAAGIEL